MSDINPHDTIRRSRLGNHAETLIALLRPSARIVVHDEASGAHGSIGSHFGGLPLLPKDASWPRWDKHDLLVAQIARAEETFWKNPRATGWRDIAARSRDELSHSDRPLAFLCELSMSELHAAARLPGWPAEGNLTFFYDPSQEWGFDPLSRGHCRVLYFPQGEELAPRQPPSDLSEDARFPERPFTFSAEWTLPDRVVLGDDCHTIFDDEYAELFKQLMPHSLEGQPVHRCGGNPQEIQGDMRLECQLVTNGIYCGNWSGYQDPRRKLLEPGAADWELLLQIDSDPDRLGWLWGDNGRVYFWLRRQDLATLDCENAWAILQCY
jgi:uncharacterized protein YwqG